MSRQFFFAQKLRAMTPIDRRRNNNNKAIILMKKMPCTKWTNRKAGFQEESSLLSNPIPC
jgi:hypothetical protein